VKHHSHDRLFAALGIGSVVAELAGVAIGAAGGRQLVTVTSSAADIRAAFEKPVTTAAWFGAYIEMLSMGMFLAFAIWACARLGGGILGSIGGATASAYTAVSITALGINDALAYRAGHGMDLQLATTMLTIGQAVFVGTWFLAVFFLLIAGAMALSAGRRGVGWSGVAIAAIILVTTAVSMDNLGQMSNMLWLFWIIGTSISLVRRPHAAASQVDVAVA
jgi:hypothetical protein